jgi:hypothetical protein
LSEPDGNISEKSVIEVEGLAHEYELLSDRRAEERRIVTRGDAGNVSTRRLDP